MDIYDGTNPSLKTCMVTFLDSGNQSRNMFVCTFDYRHYIFLSKQISTKTIHKAFPEMKYYAAIPQHIGTICLYVVYIVEGTLRPHCAMSTVL